MLRALAILVLIALVAPPAHAGRGTTLVKYLPDDATVVVVADVARARRSPIFKKAFEAARQKNDTIDALASNIAIDKLVDTIVVGGNSTGGHVVAVFEGRVDKLLSEAKKQATKEDKHAGVAFWVVPDGEVAVIDKRFIVASAGDMEHVIDRAADKKAKGPAAVRTMLAIATPNSSVFGGALLDADQKKQMAAELGADPQWLAFSCAMASKLTIEGRVKLADEAAAETVAKALNDKLGASGVDGTIRSRIEGFVGQEFSDSILVDADHSFARVSATMTGEEFDKLLTVVKMFM